jgi:hypothetical protein
MGPRGLGRNNQPVFDLFHLFLYMSDCQIRGLEGSVSKKNNLVNKTLINDSWLIVITFN